VTKTQYEVFCIIVCQKFWADYEAYQQPLSGSDEVSGGSWQIVNAICDEGDGLILRYKVMITLILLLLVLILLETDTMGTFKVLLCSPSSILKLSYKLGLAFLASLVLLQDHVCF
jgi:hypothetical protein